MAGPVTPELRFARDVAQAIAACAALTAAVVLLLDGVEQARRVAEGAIGVPEWARWVLARWPGRVDAVLPVASALGAALAAARWESDGAFVALEAAGFAPRRLAAAALVVGALAGTTGAAAREVTAGAAIAVVAPQGAWIAAGEWRIRAATLGDQVAVDVDAARVVDGRLTATFHASSASWTGQRWIIDGADATALPSPDEWRALAVGPGPDAPIAALWAARDTPPGAAWLTEALLRVVACGVLAAMAVPLARRTGGGFAVIGLAVGWRVLQSGATAAAAGAAWPLPTAVFVPAAALAAGWAVTRRFARGRSSPTG